jgi:glutamyl-tRNA synthetase
LEYQALGWELPKFAHPGLILGKDGKKLSKRHGAVYVGEYKSQGFLAEALVNFVALLGWSPGGDRELMSREEMIELFSLEGLNASPSVFDHDKLNWMNGVYIRQLSPERLLSETLPFLKGAGLVDGEPEGEQRTYALEVVKLEQERLKTLAEAPEATAFFFKDELEYDEAAVTKWLRRAEARATLNVLLARLEALPEWTIESVESAVRGTIEELGVKAGEVIHPTRVAATGRTVGPGLFETLATLGRERVLHRVRKAQAEFAPG